MQGARRNLPCNQLCPAPAPGGADRDVAGCVRQQGAGQRLGAEGMGRAESPGEEREGPGADPTEKAGTALGGAARGPVPALAKPAPGPGPAAGCPPAPRRCPPAVAGSGSSSAPPPASSAPPWPWSRPRTATAAPCAAARLPLAPPRPRKFPRLPLRCPAASAQRPGLPRGLGNGAPHGAPDRPVPQGACGGRQREPQTGLCKWGEGRKQTRLYSGG